jgi:hypothetical protein
VGRAEVSGTDDGEAHRIDVPRTRRRETSQRLVRGEALVGENWFTPPENREALLYSGVFIRDDGGLR